MRMIAALAFLFAAFLALPVSAKRAMREEDPRETSAQKKLQDGDVAGAIEDLKLVAGDRPADYQLRLRIADLVLAHDGVAAAISQWDRYLDVTSVYRQTALGNRAGLKLLKPDLAGAIADMKEAVAVEHMDRPEYGDLMRAQLWALQVIAGAGEEADKEMKAWYAKRPADAPATAMSAYAGIAAGAMDEKAAAAILGPGGGMYAATFEFYLGARALRDGKTGDAHAHFKKSVELEEKARDRPSAQFEYRAAVLAVKSLQVD